MITNNLLPFITPQLVTNFYSHLQGLSSKRSHRPMIGYRWTDGLLNTINWVSGHQVKIITHINDESTNPSSSDTEVAIPIPDNLFCVIRETTNTQNSGIFHVDKVTNKAFYIHNPAVSSDAYNESHPYEFLKLEINEEEFGIDRCPQFYITLNGLDISRTMGPYLFGMKPVEVIRNLAGEEVCLIYDETMGFYTALQDNKPTWLEVVCIEGVVTVSLKFAVDGMFYNLGDAVSAVGGDNFTTNVTRIDITPANGPLKIIIPSQYCKHGIWARLWIDHLQRDVDGISETRYYVNVI